MLGLEDEDQRAVDWIMLSRSQHGANDQSGWVLSAVVTDDHRLHFVGHWFDLLGEYSVSEPPKNLAARTLERIEARRALPVPLPPAMAPTPESLEP